MGLEKWVADGWDLSSSGIRGWEYRDGTDQVAAVQGGNGVVPNRTGEIWRSKVMGPGMFTLGLWLGGANRAAAEAQFRLLVRALVRPHRLVHMERTLSSGEVISCDAEYAGQIKPTFMGQRGMRAAIDFKVPAGVWKGTSATAETTAGDPLTQTLVLDALEPSTAAIEDASFTITGPITSPQVADYTDGVDGDVFRYDAAIAAGQTLTVNCKTWAVTGGGGLSVNQAKVYPGGRRMLSISPARPGAKPTLQLRGSGGSTGTKLSVTAAPSFAC